MHVWWEREYSTLLLSQDQLIRICYCWLISVECWRHRTTVERSIRLRSPVSSLSADDTWRQWPKLWHRCRLCEIRVVSSASWVAVGRLWCAWRHRQRAQDCAGWSTRDRCGCRRVGRGRFGRCLGAVGRGTSSGGWRLCRSVRSECRHRSLPTEIMGKSYVFMVIVMGSLLYAYVFMGYHDNRHSFLFS